MRQCVTSRKVIGSIPHGVIGIVHRHNTGCFKKSFTTLKAYRNLYRGHGFFLMGIR